MIRDIDRGIPFARRLSEGTRPSPLGVSSRGCAILQDASLKSRAFLCCPARSFVTDARTCRGTPAGMRARRVSIAGRRHRRDHAAAAGPNRSAIHAIEWKAGRHRRRGLSDTLQRRSLRWPRRVRRTVPLETHRVSRNVDDLRKRRCDALRPAPRAPGCREAAVGGLRARIGKDVATSASTTKPC